MSAILTDEQTLLLDSVRRFLDDKTSTYTQRKNIGAAELASLWNECAQMGWLQICVPEDQSGLGLSLLDAALISEEAGRSLLPLPLTQAIAVAALLPSCALDDNESSQTLAHWLQGDTYLGTTASQDSDNNSWAEYAMVGEQALDIHWADNRVIFSGYNITHADHGIDPLISTSTITREAPAWTTSGDCSSASWQVFYRRRRVLRLAELIGTSSKALEAAVAYACEREQFGKAIGINQALKHRLADNWMAIDNARLALHATCTAIEEERDTELPMLMAELLAIEASDATTRHAIQTFGAMGFTWECPMHFYLKRVKHIVALLGRRHDTAAILAQIWELA
ncbi:acyl-CoA dehydrogenase family protein [Pollutimonas harenae]|uniref:Acyl-CoA/acyl-ACP dehydrogenase n=1 Tax=Pollutimonas harenae TaxID=657015 RepID=A0A853H1R3_9BURK|nr:acyl-CoA dehydrogenase family protein [Pollutimonas harenae]NYT85175.1 acyl-CoA/acyl-ACP dehydrogenase [Pollutimonas harenae]